MAFLFPSLLLKCIFHCPMATVSPQPVAIWELEILKAIVKEFCETLQKFTPFKEQEQRRVHKGTELQRACDTGLSKGRYSWKPNSRMSISVYFKWCVFTDRVTAVVPSLFWVPSVGHRGLHVCSCVSWHSGFYSSGPTPPRTVLPLFAGRSFKGSFCSSDSWKALNSTVNHLTGV